MHTISKLAAIAAVTCAATFILLAFSGYYDGNTLKGWADSDLLSDSGTGSAQDGYRSAMFTGSVVGAFDMYM